MATPGEPWAHTVEEHCNQGLWNPTHWWLLYVVAKSLKTTKIKSHSISQGHLAPGNGMRTMGGSCSCGLLTPSTALEPNWLGSPHLH